MDYKQKISMLKTNLNNFNDALTRREKSKYVLIKAKYQKQELTNRAFIQFLKTELKSLTEEEKKRGARKADESPEQASVNDVHDEIIKNIKIVKNMTEIRLGKNLDLTKRQILITAVKKTRKKFPDTPKTVFESALKGINNQNTI